MFFVLIAVTLTNTNTHKMSTHSDSYEQRKAIATNAALRKLSAIGCHSMPNSPRLMPKHAHFLRSSASPARSITGPSAPSTANTNDSNQSIGNGSSGHGSAVGWHFSALTDHLNVEQVNNYNNPNGIPEINWQERCLELQLELHRSRNQGERIRGLLRDKVSKSKYCE